jgi:hypothetical protein
MGDECDEAERHKANTEDEARSMQSLPLGSTEKSDTIEGDQSKRFGRFGVEKLKKRMLHIATRCST